MEKEKKRILYYYKLFFAGGTEHSILKHIKKLYQDYEIFVAYDEEESTDIVLKEIAKYAQVIDLNQIDSIVVDVCIWCSHSRQGTFQEFAKKVIASHYYYWCHILLFETFPNLEFPRDLMENIEKFICVSETVKKDIVSKYPGLESKCEVIENYLDTKEILEKANEPIELNISHDRLNIISVSRIDKDKGFGRMKTICDILDEKAVEYDWYVLGTAFKQETLDEIQGWFQENNHVHFIGYRDNVYPYIKQMDYLALLTERESWGLVITEALILGVPVIVTNFDGVEQQVTDGENGIIVDMTDKDGNYRRKIEEALLKKEQLKNNVRQQDHSRENIINRWRELFDHEVKKSKNIEKTIEDNER